MMPDVNLLKGKVYIEDPTNHKILELGEADNIEFNKVENTYDTYNSGTISSIKDEISLTYKPATMSRKRFIKLLMSAGMQRNAAVGLAEYIHKKRVCYSSIDLAIIVGGIK